MPSARSSGTTGFPAARPPMNSVPAYDVVKTRVLLKLQERFDPARARRMPASLFREAARQQVEQIVEAEAHRLPRPDRERLVEDVLGEAFGFGPLEELFTDPGVREVVVLGPQAVIARRAEGWLPTNVKFRDTGHLHETLEKVATRGEAVGDALPATGLDVKLPNGFRAVAVVPPPALGVPPTVAFVRIADTAAPVPAPQAAVPGGGNTRTPQPAVHRTPAPGDFPLDRHRARITELLIARLAGIGVYDLSGIPTPELRKVVAAYVEEYCRFENVWLSDTDQARLTLEILTVMKR